MIAAIEQITRTAAAALTGALLLLPMVTPVGHAADGALPRFAQASGPGGSSNRAASPPAQSAAAPAAGIDQEIAQLHQELKITPAQEQPFKAFADIMRGNARELEQLMRQRPAAGRSNAVEDLRMATRLAETHSAGMKRLLPVFEALYNTLSAEQRKVADNVIGRPAEQGQPGRPPG